MFSRYLLQERRFILIYQRVQFWAYGWLVYLNLRVPWNSHTRRFDIKFDCLWTTETSLVKVVVYIITGNSIEADNLMLVLTIVICCSIRIRLLFLNWWMFGRWNLDREVIIKVLFHFEHWVFFNTWIPFLYVWLPQGPSDRWHLFGVACRFRLWWQISFVFNIVCLLLNWLVEHMGLLMAWGECMHWVLLLPLLRFLHAVMKWINRLVQLFYWHRLTLNCLFPLI